MNISAIVAVSKNNIIGNNNNIPWYLPADLKYFKKVTLNHAIIMGRKTFQSIGKPLPKRTNIILTRDPFFVASGCLIVHNLQEALTTALNYSEEVFIIGGGEIYALAMPYVTKVYITEVDIEVEGNIRFPELSPLKWQEISAKQYDPDEKNQYAYTFKILVKSQK